MTSSPGRKAKIDIDDVRNACLQLTELGTPVNPYQVQKMLGQGHHSTIEKLLFEIAEQDALANPDETSETKKADFTQRLLLKIKPLADELQDDAARSIQIANTAHLDEKKALQQEIDVLKTQLSEQLDSARELNDTLALETLSLKTAVDNQRELEIELNASQQEHQRLADRYQQQTDHVEDLKKQRDKAQQETQHLDASLKTQLNEKDRRFDEASLQWQTKQTQLQAENVVLQNRITDLSVANTGLENKNDHLIKANSTLQLILTKTEQTLSEAVTDNHRLESEMADLQQAQIKTEAELAYATLIDRKRVRELDELTSSYNACHLSISTLETSLTAAEASRDTLQSLLDRFNPPAEDDKEN